jgi:hypothetical protein
MELSKEDIDIILCLRMEDPLMPIVILGKWTELLFKVSYNFLEIPGE